MFAWEQTEQVNELEEAARRLTQIDAQIETLKGERKLLAEQIGKEFNAAVDEEQKTFGRYVVSKTTPIRRSFDVDKLDTILAGHTGPLPACIERPWRVDTRAYDKASDDDKRLLAPALIESRTAHKFEIAEITTTTEDEHAPTA
jgi:hypothetical protein